MKKIKENYITGRAGEQKAAELFTNIGFEIIHTNYQYYGNGRGRKGEIDIIAFDAEKKVVHFVEVKSRKSKTFGEAKEQISLSKIRSLRSAIEDFCIRHPQFLYCYKQIDVVAIDDGKEPEVIFNAIQFD